MKVEADRHAAVLFDYMPNVVFFDARRRDRRSVARHEKVVPRRVEPIAIAHSRCFFARLVRVFENLAVL